MTLGWFEKFVCMFGENEFSHIGWFDISYHVGAWPSVHGRGVGRF